MREPPSTDHLGHSRKPHRRSRSASPHFPSPSSRGLDLLSPGKQLDFGITAIAQPTAVYPVPMPPTTLYALHSVGQISAASSQSATPVACSNLNLEIEADWFTATEIDRPLAPANFSVIPASRLRGGGDSPTTPTIPSTFPDMEKSLSPPGTVRGPRHGASGPMNPSDNPFAPTPTPSRPASRAHSSALFTKRRSPSQSSDSSGDDDGYLLAPPMFTVPNDQREETPAPEDWTPTPDLIDGYMDSGGIIVETDSENPYRFVKRATLTIESITTATRALLTDRINWCTLANFLTDILLDTEITGNLEDARDFYESITTLKVTSDEMEYDDSALVFLFRALYSPPPKILGLRKWQGCHSNAQVRVRAQSELNPSRVRAQLGLGLGVLGLRMLESEWSPSNPSGVRAVQAPPSKSGGGSGDIDRALYTYGQSIWDYLGLFGIVYTYNKIPKNI
ncbi:hypothetical protein F5887DRAFT_1081819 [Amanita rubescens]|nr:hypothetical protein F5887DRAFT_1081819 [Amanita rubescens]